MNFLKQKAKGVVRRLTALNLTELNQAKLDAATAWVQRTKVGNVALNIASLSVLGSVSGLKRVKGVISGSSVESLADQSNLSLIPYVQDKPRVCIVAEASIPQCLHYRVEQKIEQLTALDCHVEWLSWSDIAASEQRFYVNDIIIFYRVPGMPKVLNLMKLAKCLNKLVIYDVDDLVFDRQALKDKFGSSTAQLTEKAIESNLQAADLYKSAIELADYGIAPTADLQKELAQHVRLKKCFLLKNGLSSEIESLRESTVVKSESDDVIVFYGSGTKTHDVDFSTIAQPLSQVMMEQSNVKLIIAGHLSLPSVFGELEDQVQRLPLLDFKSYLKCLQHADIAIAPLELNTFSDCKSEIKWLEAANFSVPSVVASTSCYEAIVKEGETGFLASDTESWYKALSELASDKKLREKIGKAAQKQADTFYSSVAMSQQMQDLLEDVQVQAVADGVCLPLSKKPKKHVLLVNVLYPPQAIGGATTVVAQSVEQLRSRYSEEIQITVLTTEMSDGSPYSVRQYEENGVSVFVIRTPLHKQLEHRPQDDCILGVCQSLYSQIKPDLIHFHSVQRLTGSSVQAAKDLCIPYFVTVHDAWWLSEHQFLLDKNSELVNHCQANPFIALETAESANDALFRFEYLSEQLRGAEKIIAVSGFQNNLYQQNGFDNVVTIRNGVSVTEVVANKKKVKDRKHDSLVIGYLGGISAHKGYDFMKEVVCTNQWKNLHFKVVDLFKPNAYQSEEVWGESSVSYVGKVPSNEVASFYQGIDVLIAPSIWPESFGLVTREAALNGVWVVAANAGGMAEDVIEGETGFVFPMRDELKLAEILASLDSKVEYFKNQTPEVHKSEQKIISQEQNIKALYSLYADDYPKK